MLEWSKGVNLSLAKLADDKVSSSCCAVTVIVIDDLFYQALKCFYVAPIMMGLMMTLIPSIHVVNINFQAQNHWPSL
jgi:hypothetical protein